MKYHPNARCMLGLPQISEGCSLHIFIHPSHFACPSRSSLLILVRHFKWLVPFRSYHKLYRSWLQLLVVQSYFCTLCWSTDTCGNLSECNLNQVTCHLILHQMRKCNLNQAPCHEACDNFALFTSLRSPAHQCSRCFEFPLSHCNPVVQHAVSSPLPLHIALNFRSPLSLYLYLFALCSSSRFLPPNWILIRKLVKSGKMTQIVHSEGVTRHRPEPETQGGGLKYGDTQPHWYFWFAVM